MPEDINLAAMPNLIIGGAPKCGTSSLFFWLGAHPEVCASKLKETYFLNENVNRFNKNLNVHEHGLAAYSRFFFHSKGEKWRLEATPVYIYQDYPLDIISKYLKETHVVFILRKPADRLYSHWKFNRYRMKNNNLSFEDYLDYSNAPSNWANYLDQTRYVNYIQRWVDALGKNRIHILQFESMQKDRVAFMKSVSQKLEIDPIFYEDFGFFRRNETVAIRGKWLHRLGLKIEPLVPTWLQEWIIPIYIKYNSSKVPNETETEMRAKRRITEEFYNDNQRLKNLFPEIDLSLWE